MTVSVQEAGPFERKVSFTVTEAELEAAKTTTARRLSREVKIRGFRPGKAPRPIVEATVGSDRLRSEAIDDILPAKVGEVLVDSGITPALNPRLEQVTDAEGGGVDVDVLVTLWPTLETIPEHRERRIVVEPPAVTDEEVAAQIDRLRDQYATLETVDRPAAVGDYVALDVSALHDGADVPEAQAEEILYEVGSGGLIEGVDDVLVGVAAGESVVFEGVLPQGFGEIAGLDVTFTVRVSEVREKILPELTDEWVDEASEFETVDDLREGLRRQLEILKRRDVAAAFRQKALDELVAEVEIDLPDALVRAEMDEVLHEFGHRLDGSGITLDDYFRVTGIPGEEFVDDLRRQAEASLRTRLLLEAVGAREGIEVAEEEIDAVVEAAVQTTDDPDAYRAALESRRSSLAGDILRNKALDAVIRGAVPVDEEGNIVDIELPGDVEAELVGDPDEGEGSLSDSAAGRGESADEEE